MRAVERIVVIGCGGIGSWLLGPLLRFLNAEGFGGEVHLWDGDHYTVDNQERQEFAAGSIGENKAEVQAGAFRSGEGPPGGDETLNGRPQPLRNHSGSATAQADEHAADRAHVVIAQSAIKRQTQDLLYHPLRDRQIGRRG